MNKYMVARRADKTILLNIKALAEPLTKEDVLNIVTWFMLVNDIEFPELQENMQLEQQ